jgi:hypothetical protein
MPFVDRILSRDYNRIFLAPVLDNFHEVALFRVRFGFHDKVIDYADFDLFDSFEVFEIHSGCAGGQYFLKEAFVSDFNDRKALMTGLVGGR